MYFVPLCALTLLLVSTRLKFILFLNPFWGHKPVPYSLGYFCPNNFHFLNRFSPFVVTGRAHIWAKAGFTTGWVNSSSQSPGEHFVGSQEKVFRHPSSPPNQKNMFFHIFGSSTCAQTLALLANKLTTYGVLSCPCQLACAPLPPPGIQHRKQIPAL